MWGLVEPLDTRVFGSDYRAVALLGKAVTRGRGWRPAGYALHAFNGATFGLLFESVRKRVDADPRRVAIALALVESFVLWPANYVVDRKHPARGEPGVPPLLTSARAFAQETFRHLLFGFVLGRLASKRR